MYPLASDAWKIFHMDLINKYKIQLNTRLNTENPKKGLYVGIVLDKISKPKVGNCIIVRCSGFL